MVERLLSGRFAAASPERGSFRRMLAVAAHNLARTLWAKKCKQGASPPTSTPWPNRCPRHRRRACASARGTGRPGPGALDAYQRLAHGQRRPHPDEILRIDFPDDDSDQLAERLSRATGRTFRSEAMRQQLRRARLRFAEALLEEVRAASKAQRPSASRRSSSTSASCPTSATCCRPTGACAANWPPCRECSASAHGFLASVFRTRTSLTANSLADPFASNRKFHPH